jgi:hypothetical protein
MEEINAFWLVAGASTLFYIFSKINNYNEKVDISNYKELFEKWIVRNNGILGGYLFSSYKDNELSVFNNSRIIVGTFKRNDNLDPAGFLIEIYENEIVLEKLFFPSEIASYHKTASVNAKLLGTSMYQILCNLESAQT